jgi:hypothetical protein
MNNDNDPVLLTAEMAEWLAERVGKYGERPIFTAALRAIASGKVECRAVGAAPADVGGLLREALEQLTRLHRIATPTECFHEPATRPKVCSLCETIAKLEALRASVVGAGAEPATLGQGALWSFLRTVMQKGSDLGVQFNDGALSYEHHSAHLDAEASHFAKQLHNLLASPAPLERPQQHQAVGRGVTVVAVLDGKPTATRSDGPHTVGYAESLDVGRASAPTLDAGSRSSSGLGAADPETEALLRECADFLSVTIGGNGEKRQELADRISAHLRDDGCPND